MNNLHKVLYILVAGVAIALPCVLLASTPVRATLVKQTWDKVSHAHDSCIKACGSPDAIIKAIAVDDFKLSRRATIKRVMWWGTLTKPPRPTDRYYIAFYRNDPHVDCAPLWDLIGRPNCVRARVRSVGADCQGKKVYLFDAVLTEPKRLTPEHYWIQISEDDSHSVTIGEPNFRWSSTRPVEVCQALGRKKVTDPWTKLLDTCNGKRQPADLAFVLIG